ncbi:MAG: LysM peptidoglycan-binding domain-containing protein, partial [Streptosporangiaceae bacterium]
MTRTPRYTPRRRRRSAGDLLAGLLAIAALAALTVGVPFALVTVFGLPVPREMPSLALLTHQLDLPALLKVLSLLVWVAWIQLVWCVIAEIRAAVRNAGMPRRVPLAGGTQALVHRLVTAALLVFAATTALSPALAHQALATPHSVTAGSGRGTSSSGHPGGVTYHPGGGTRQAGGGAGQPGGRGVSPPDGRGVSPPGLASPPQVAHSPQAGKLYVVKPPVGRFHESLWEIAQKYLGDGRRYREIFDLNSGRVQPDGSRLTIASLIRPGWVLHMPQDAHGPGIEVVPVRDSQSAADGPGSSGARASTPPHRAGTHSRTGEHSRAGEHGRGGEHARSGEHAGTTDRARPGEPTGSGHHARSGEHGGAGEQGHPGKTGHSRPPAGANGSAAGGLPHPGGLGYPDELAAAALLATGILAALGRQRREQLWQRAFGRRVVAPEGRAALAESALRAGAHEPSARLLDRGLRYLSRALALEGRTPPAVVAAHLSPENLDLWVAPADLDAPAPWTAVGDGQVWRLPFTALGRVGVDEAGDAQALFPGLVSIGADRTGRVLVNLEAAHGVISVTGPQAMTTGVLSSMAMELATSRWSDQMRITLAGFGGDLIPMAPDRITAVPTMDEALPALEAHAAEVAEAMAASGVSSALAGRSLGADPDAWAPHYLISVVPPSPWERSRLLALARAGRAAAAGYVVAGDVPGSAWAWEVTPEGRLLAGELGFDVQAQLIPARQHEALVDLFGAAARP